MIVYQRVGGSDFRRSLGPWSFGSSTFTLIRTEFVIPQRFGKIRLVDGSLKRVSTCMSFIVLSSLHCLSTPNPNVRWISIPSSFLRIRSSGWWFQTLFIFHNMGCHPSHWRTPSFFKMVKSPPTSLCSLLFTAISGVSQPSGRVQAEHRVWILSAPDSVMGCRRSAETRGTSKHGGFLSHGGVPPNHSSHGWLWVTLW